MARNTSVADGGLAGLVLATVLQLVLGGLPVSRIGLAEIRGAG